MEIDANAEQQIGNYIGSLLNDSLSTAAGNLVSNTIGKIPLFN